MDLYVTEAHPANTRLVSYEFRRFPYILAIKRARRKLWRWMDELDNTNWYIWETTQRWVEVHLWHCCHTLAPVYLGHFQLMYEVEAMDTATHFCLKICAELCRFTSNTCTEHTYIMYKQVFQRLFHLYENFKIISDSFTVGLRN